MLVASETLALAALAQGFEAKQSEVHGVAQRGGSVVSHVRFGEKVFSPLARCGEVDVMFAIERLEALRYAHYLKPGGRVVMDDRAIKPIQMPGAAEASYPENVPEFLREKGHPTTVVPALQAAIDAGDKRCANIVLLGSMSAFLDLPAEAWQTALEMRFPEKILDLNRRACAEGKRLANGS